MNRRLVAFIIIVAIIVGLFLFLRRPSKEILPSPQENTIDLLQLPSGWQLISSTDKSFKLEKTGDYQIKPLIIASVTSLPVTRSGQKYLDLLVSGAKSTIPGLKYTVNLEENTDNQIARQLVGSYYSGKNKINVFQRISIQNDNVITLTASCLIDSCTETEVKPIFDTLTSRLAN